MYEEGGISGVLLKQGKKLCECPTDTTLVQLKPLRPTPEEQIRVPEDVINLVRDMEDFDREHIRVLHLDTNLRVIGIETVSVGILDSALMHPREILKGAILDNAAGIIMVHNHPSGDCIKSPEDNDVEEQLKKACEIIGIHFHDNIVVSKECYSSKECEHCELPAGE
jgi:DNA repair protein RadC